jgi:hypothetical protein
MSTTKRPNLTSGVGETLRTGHVLPAIGSEFDTQPGVVPDGLPGFTRNIGTEDV